MPKVSDVISISACGVEMAWGMLCVAVGVGDVKGVMTMQVQIWMFGSHRLPDVVCGLQNHLKAFARRPQRT